MFAIVKSAVTALQLYLMRRRQFDNAKLRQHFSDRYDIVVGLYSYGCFDRWRMPGPLRIGRYCSIASTVRVAPKNHPISALTTHPALYEKQFGVVDADAPPAEPLVIEDDVWIGHNAVILPGCKHIGRGAVIGAGAIVTKDVAAYAVMAGTPAQNIRDRFTPELAAAIDATRWWELDLAGLRALLRERPEVVNEPTVAALQAWERDRGR